MKKNIRLEAKIHNFSRTGNEKILDNSFESSSGKRLLIFIIIAILTWLSSIVLSIFISDWNIEKFWIVGILCAAVGAYIQELYNSYTIRKNADQGLKQLAYKKTKYDEAIEESENYTGNIRTFLEKLGINNYANIKTMINELAQPTSNIDELFENTVRGELLKVISSYYDLKDHGEKLETYRMQFELAHHLSLISKDRFWATSTDRVGIFQKKNFKYYEALYRLSKQLNIEDYFTYEEEIIPRFCRVFIGSVNSFTADVMNDFKYFIEMYKMHLNWGNTIKKNLIPIKFFINEDLEYDQIISKYNISNSPIRDFMLIDEEIVYGREGEYYEHEIKLRLTTEKEKTKKYEKVFIELWEKSHTIKDLLNQIFYKFSDDNDERKKEYERIIQNVEKKLNLTNEYSDIFTDEHLFEGENFFDLLCNNLKKAENSIIAIDRASKKTRNLWKAWNEEEEYLKFHESCSEASRNLGTKVYRIFIIESSFELHADQIEDAIKYMKKILDEDNWTVKFIPSHKLKDTLTLDYLYDFLITGLPIDLLISNKFQEDKFQNRLELLKNQCIGFELLGDQYFLKSALNLRDNLISKDMLTERAVIFKELFDNEDAICANDYLDRENIEQSINNLFIKIF